MVDPYRGLVDGKLRKTLGESINTSLLALVKDWGFNLTANHKFVVVEHSKIEEPRAINKLISYEIFFIALLAPAKCQISNGLLDHLQFKIFLLDVFNLFFFSYKIG